MSKPWSSFLTCTVLSFTIGLVVWLAWPTGRSFSYLNDVRPAYLIEQPQTTGTITQRAQPVSRAREAVTDLTTLIRGTGHVYSTLWASMQDRLEWRGTTVTGLGFVAAYGQYQEARGLQLTAGQPPRVNRNEVALTERVARQLTVRPEELIGQTVVLNPQTAGDQFTVTAIVKPSLWQSFEDPDIGGYRIVDPAAPGLDEMTKTLIGLSDPRMTLVFDRTPAASQLDQVRTYVTRHLPGFRLVDLTALQQGSADTRVVQDRLRSRARALPLMATLLMVSGLLSRGVTMIADLLRRRALFGVDLSSGATRALLLRDALLAQLLPSAAGSSLGVLMVFLVPGVLKEILVGPPPIAVLALAWAIPVLATTGLTAVIAIRVLSDSAYALLQGARPGQFVLPLLGAMLVAFALALGGLFSALGVKEKLDRQAQRINQEFGRVLHWSTGGDADARKEEGTVFSSRRLSALDVRWLEQQPEVASASIAERLDPDFLVNGKVVRIDRPIVGDRLPDVLDISLIQGSLGGCLLTQQQAKRYDLRIGSVLQVNGKARALPCPVTGIMETPDPLKTFVMDSFPGLIVPTRIGLAAGSTAPQVSGKTTDIVLRLSRDADRDTVASLRARMAQRLGDDRFALRPYTPSIDALLLRLRQQSQLFLAVATLSVLVTLSGLFGGFLAYLDATRFRMAVERTQGLTIGALRRTWALGGLTLGIGGAIIALLIAVLLTPALYNAFSLDAPVGMALDLLPKALPALPGTGTLLATAGFVVFLTSTLMQLGVQWLRRQSLLAMLKAGS